MGSKGRAVFRLVFILLCLGLLCLVPLFYFIWPLDIILAREVVVATALSEDGDAFEVWQKWNHGDFYTTGFRYTQPDGRAFEAVIDPDNLKIWRCRLSVEKARDVVTVFRGNYLMASYNRLTRVLSIPGSDGTLTREVWEIGIDAPCP